MNLSHRIWAVWVLVTYAWAYLVIWSVTTRTSPPGPSQVTDTGNQGGPAPEDAWPQYFWGELLAAWLWKLDTGNTSLCALLPVQPCETRRTCHAWVLACTPGPNDQPHHGILWEQPPYAQLETNWRRVSSNSLGLVWWFHSHPYWLTSGGGLLLWTGLFPAFHLSV